MRVLEAPKKGVVWSIPGGGTAKYRVAESLDHDMAEAMAAKYAGDILKGEAVLEDFGLAPVSQTQIITQLAENLDDFRAYATHFLAIALAERCLDSFADIGRIKDKVLEVTRPDLAFLFKDDTIQRDWLQKVRAAVFAKAAEGNGSGSPSNMISDGGQNSAENAKDATSPAPAVPAELTDLDAPVKSTAQKPSKEGSSSKSSKAQVSGKPAQTESAE